MVWPKAENSWPSVIGTASWSWVRPIFSTSANSAAFSAKAWRSPAMAWASRSIPCQAAILSAVG